MLDVGGRSGERKKVLPFVYSLALGFISKNY